MTDVGEWREIAEWDWVEFPNGDDEYLHAVGTLDNADTVDDEWIGVGTTACGLSGTMVIPGVFARMGVPRCNACCEVTGMPPGEQSPKNVDECRPVVEERLHMLKS